jgi:hypothetical protein
MTCLVATREGVWADRRVSNGPAVYRPARKLVRGVGLVAGFCGDSAACTKAMRAVTSGESDPDVLAEASEGLLVTDEGEIWELWGKIAERVPHRFAFACGGSGYAEAQAFLSGAAACDPDTVRRALRYVARVRSDCGDGVDGMLVGSR